MGALNDFTQQDLKRSRSAYRLHKVKHLAFLDLLHLEDVLQGDLVEVLPHAVHLAVRLRQHTQGHKHRDTHTRTHTQGHTHRDTHTRTHTQRHTHKDTHTGTAHTGTHRDTQGTAHTGTA